MRIRVSGRWSLLGWLSLLPLALAARAPHPVPNSPAPERYWVSFADKTGVKFDPKTYFSLAAQARRQRQGLPAYEASDLPVRPDYLARVRAGSDTLTLISRWFNAAACRATPTQAAALRH
jgi:serine protease AprX